MKCEGLFPQIVDFDVKDIDQAKTNYLVCKVRR